MKFSIRLFQIYFIIFFIISNLAYPFGKNKVVYNTYDWNIIETENTKIYLINEILFLSDYIANEIESSIAYLSKVFNYIPKIKTKILIYPNQIDFQQNNVVDWIGEGTGGFTEFIKGRIVLPYSSDSNHFKHIITHELTHAFQAYILGKGTININVLRDIEVPLWVIEGMSEYLSIGIDYECEMMISDGITYGILPSLMELSDLYNLKREQYYFIYKEGQIFYEFLVKNYNEKIISKLLFDLSSNKNFYVSISNVTGMNITDLNNLFFDYIRKKYKNFDLEDVNVVAKKLLKDDSFFNSNPVYLNSNKIAFITDRLIYPSIVIYDKEKNYMERIIKGGFNEDYLEFHYGKRNNLSISTNGLLCFLSRGGDSDKIYLYNIYKKSIKKIDLPFRIINSPDISKDGSKIIFSAINNYQEDLFLYDVYENRIYQLTEDKNNEIQPRWLNESNIIFISDKFNSSNLNNLYFFNVYTKEIIGSLNYDFSISYPSVSPDGLKISFVKDDINPSLYIYDLISGDLYREIIPYGGIFSHSFLNSNKIVLVAYNKNSYNIFEYIVRYDRKITNITINEKEITISTINTNNEKINKVSFNTSKYNLELSIDNILGGLSVNSYLGAAVMGLIQGSDMLGDHRFRLLMDSFIVIDTNFFNYLNMDFFYEFLKFRHSFGINIFHFSNYLFEILNFNEFYDFEDIYDRTYGIFLYYSYPFTTFDRIDVDIGYRFYSYITNLARISNNDVIYYYKYRDRNIINLSYIHDSTLWNETGPIDGLRSDITLTKSFKLFENSIDYLKIIGDLRYYWLMYINYSFAFRLVLGKIWIDDLKEMPFYLGGYNSLRGYNLYSYMGDTLFLMNFEFRFPLLLKWIIGFPLPINMPVIWGSLFWDVGIVWNWGDNVELWKYELNKFRLKDLKSGIGVGMRLVLVPGIKLMLDFAAPYDFYNPPNDWKIFWQIGMDF